MAVMIAVAALGARRGVLMQQQRFDDAVKTAQSDTAYAQGIETILKTADALLTKGDLGKVDYLGAAYMLTGDKRYADRAREILLNGIKATTWADKEMMMRNPPWNSELQMAHKLFAVSCAYDAIFDTLTPTDRRSIAQGYYRLAIKPLYDDWINAATRIHSLNSMGHNWWSSCVGICGVGALTFAGELPQAQQVIDGVSEAIKGYFAFEGDDYQSKPRTYDRNGGMYESINYAAYGCQEAMLYMLALKNATGKTLGRLPQLDNMADFFIHASYPTDSLMLTAYFGDSHKTTTGHNALMLLDALGYGSNDINWYIDNCAEAQHREFMGLGTPVGIQYTPRYKKVHEPDMPLSQLYPDMGWATMRDSWSDDATMLAVKSGMTWNHSHADAGSFILFHRGHDIIGEAGRCWYKLPEYRDYYFQSPAHNVVMLDGEGQPTFQQYHGSSLPGKVSHLMDTLGVRYVLADATGPNADRFNRYKRSFLWIDGVILIIDDLASHRQGAYEWLWHPVGEVKKTGIDLDVRNGDAHVLLRQLYPETLAPSDFIHDYPTKMTWQVHEATGEDRKESLPYWSFHLPKTHDRVMGVTAIILDADNAPVIEKRQGDGWIGLDIKRGDKTTRVYVNKLADGSLMHLNSWINPDGWTTDAYITALGYDTKAALDNATPSLKTVIYGSKLQRQGEQPIFNTLAKENRTWR